jgi:hypothetical protein
MNDETVARIFENVKGLLGNDPPRNPRSGFAELLVSVHTAVQPDAGPRDLVFRAAVAVCRLGLALPGAPPVDLCAVFTTFLKSKTSETALAGDYRLMDLAVAYGCGAWRGTSEQWGWGGRWPGAVSALQNVIESQLNKLDEWFGGKHDGSEGKVPGYEKMDRPTVIAVAYWLAAKLWRPGEGRTLQPSEEISVSVEAGGEKVRVAGPREWGIDQCPSGWRAVWELTRGQVHLFPEGFAHAPEILIWEVGDSYASLEIKNTRPDPDRERSFSIRPEQRITLSGEADFLLRACTCAQPRCSGLHRLEAWDPDRSELAGFLKFAIIGEPVTTGELQAGQIATGMFYTGKSVWPLPELVEVEVSICHGHPAEFPNGVECPTGVCVLCGTVDSKHKITVRRFILPDQAYDRRLRLRCSNLGEHYRALTNSRAPEKLSEEHWRNVYDLPGTHDHEEDEEFWSQRQEMKRLHSKPRSLRSVAGQGGRDPAETLAAIDRRLGELQCPICKAPAPQRPSQVWVKNLQLAADPTAAETHPHKRGTKEVAGARED